jgi:uncharacterized protein (TIGR00369 family)
LTSEAPEAKPRVTPYTFEPHNCFACGQLNAAGMQLQIHVEDGRSWTEIELPRRFEGWEGIVHGGILSAIADEVMAWAVISTGELGVTVRMEMDYRRPVTVGQAIRADGWTTERRRRRFETAARIVAPGTGDVLVEARGTYLAVPSAQAEKLRARYGIQPARVDGLVAAPVGTTQTGGPVPLSTGER